MVSQTPVSVDRRTRTERGLGLIFLAGLFCSLPVTAGDPPDESDAGIRYEAIKSRAIRQWNTIATLRAVITKTAEFGDSEKRALQRVVGQYEYLSKEGKLFVRWDTVDMTAIRMDQADTLKRVRNLIVHDGAYTYILRETSSRTGAEKFAPGVVDLMPLGGPGFFENLERRFTLEVLPSEVLNGREVFVIEARPKRGGEKVLHYLDKENGLLAKKQKGSRAEGTYDITVVTGVDTTVTFEKDHFVFVPPEGVEVYDDSKRTSGGKKRTNELAPAAGNPAADSKGARPRKKDDASETKDAPDGD